MSHSGANTDLVIATRAALLDALQALDAHRDAVIVIGAQAVYLHTGNLHLAVAEATKDSDLAIDPRELGDDPHLEQAMTQAGLYRDPTKNQPGAWLNPAGIPVDLMVPERLAGQPAKGRRGARIPPHDNQAARRAVGLEAVVVDQSVMRIAALDPADGRTYDAHVAGPAALMVAKLHKLAERENDRNPGRINNKDAHDIYRLLQAIPTSDLAASVNRLLQDDLSGEITRRAVDHLRRMFADSKAAPGSTMAGEAERGLGDVAGTALAVSLLAQDLIAAIETTEN